MAIESRRGCGFRKVGGLYLVCDASGFECGRLPIPLTICPCCGSGIKQARGWTWIDPVALLSNHLCKLDCVTTAVTLESLLQQGRAGCPLSDLSVIGDQAGLLWVGERFYPTVDHFNLEARHLGISKRIASVPRDLVIGETWVMLAHPKAATTFDEELGTRQECPGIFRVFKPQRLEMLILESDTKDETLMKRLERQNITAVIVPDDDMDHRGSVYK